MTNSLQKQLRDLANRIAAGQKPLMSIPVNEERDGDVLAVRAAERIDELEHLLSLFLPLRDAVRIFVRIIETSSGRIPTEQLSASDWHKLCLAFNAVDLALQPPTNEA